MQKLSWLILFLACFSLLGKAQSWCNHRKSLSVKSDPREQLYESLHYDLFLDFKYKAMSEIRGEAKIDLLMHVDTTDIVLDIKSYDIYQVDIPGAPTSFSFNDSLLRISNTDGFVAGDTLSIVIEYGGETHTESARFGGFFFKPPYAYNIGVAFQEIPHNFGRTWYPCLDYFTSRATYTTRTLTYDGDISVSAGVLSIDSIVQGDTLYREWEMRDPIPTYLHSISIAPFEKLSWNHQGVNSSFPVELYALSADTANLRGSFVDLDSAISYYEESYYDHMWQKVGYSILPMSGGAMEHATNIAYPSFAVNGNTDFETLMAHELAHSWWGNLVTCDRASEMWLNEGWASFSEYLFLEKRYGWERAVEEIQSVQYDVLRNADHEEGGYLPVSGVPEPYIYGTHVYDKGSLVALALREYLGDDFESTIRTFFDRNQFVDINSDSLQNELEAITGESMDHFFEPWVRRGGFVDYFIKDMQSNNASAIMTELQQTLTGTSYSYNDVPLELSFIYDDLSRTTHSAFEASYSMNKSPEHIIVNAENKLPLACTWDEVITDQNGALNLARVDLGLSVSGLQDSAWIRVEQHWSPAPIELDNAIDLKVKISGDRYWRILSISDVPFSSTAILRYDGREPSRLDSELNGVHEDSIVLLYKPLYNGEWELFDHYSQNKVGNDNDAFGIFDLSEVPDGNYAIGIIDETVSLEDQYEQNIYFYPNPSNGEIRLSEKAIDLNLVRILNMEGKLMMERSADAGCTIDLSEFGPGIYWIEWSGEATTIKEKVVIQ